MVYTRRDDTTQVKIEDTPQESTRTIEEEKATDNQPVRNRRRRISKPEPVENQEIIETPIKEEPSTKKSETQ